jgi:GNAT superfamily N-acetyltransferase
VSAAVEIRPFRHEDAPAAAELLAPIVPPDYPVNAAALVHGVESLPPEDGAYWVADARGDIVGWAEATRHLASPERDVQRIWAAVRDDHRRNGLGARLFRTAEERALGYRPRQLRSWTRADEPDGGGFLRTRGFALRRTERLWALDPTTVDLSDLPRREREAAAAGYRLAPLHDLLDRPEDLHRTFTATDVDVPSDIAVSGLPFEEWRRFTLGDPLLDPDGSFVVLAAGLPVALAWLAVDRERGLAGNMMTGTLREHRHRGLARLAKLATIRWAAANGVRRIGTGNDSTNRDMLALNEHLGYRPLPEHLVFAREVAGPAEP